MSERIERVNEFLSCCSYIVASPRRRASLAVKQRHEFTNVNEKYPNYQKVARMRVQFVPGSSFLRAAHAKSLGTRLDSNLRHETC